MAKNEIAARGRELDENASKKQSMVDDRDFAIVACSVIWAG
jgi:hypothetical protein